MLHGGNCLHAPGLCLGALSKVPIEMYILLIKVPFAKEKSPCPFKYEASDLNLHTSVSKKLFKTQSGGIPIDPAILAAIGHRFTATKLYIYKIQTRGSEAPRVESRNRRLQFVTKKHQINVIFEHAGLCFVRMFLYLKCTIICYMTCTCN